MEDLHTISIEKRIKALRLKERLYKILAAVFTGGMFLTVLTMLIPLAIVLAILAGIFTIMASKVSGQIKSIVSSNIVEDVITEIFGVDVKYEPTGVIRPGSMVFPFSYNVHEGSDHITTNYNGLNIELGDISLLRVDEYTDENGQRDETRYVEFKGQWLTCDFGKELSGQVYVSQRSKKSEQRSMKSDVTMDNAAFAERFCVRADNPEEAFYILTPNMMEYISKLADNCGGILYISFMREGKMHVAVKTNRDFFELGKSSVDTDGLRQKFKEELLFFTDIIDTLRVVDTIYKKGTK